MTEEQITTELTKLATLAELRGQILEARSKQALTAPGANPPNVTLLYNGLTIVTVDADLIEQGRAALFTAYQTQIENLITTAQDERRAD